MSQAARPYIAADTVDNACLRALRLIKTRTGRTIGGKGGELNGEDYQEGDWIRIGTLWTMDDPGLQWAIWLNLTTDGGIARPEAFQPGIRARHSPHRSEPLENGGVASGSL